MKWIDFHTHILPAVDDGSDSMETSISMLNSLAEQNVGTVVLTPHFYSNRESIETFVERRDEAFRGLSEVCPAALSIRRGAEVYYSEYLFNNRDLTPLCIDGTRTLLLELPFSKRFESSMVRQIDRLIGEFNVTPVLAHIERYPSLLRSEKTLWDLLDIGCVLQVNVSSFKAFGKRKLLSMAKKGMIGALGTDSHNLSSRPPVYREGLNVLEKAVGQQGLNEIYEVMCDLIEK